MSAADEQLVEQMAFNKNQLVSNDDEEMKDAVPEEEGVRLTLSN